MLKAIGLFCAAICVAFLVEPFFPLGDWRWGALAVVALMPNAIWHYRDKWMGWTKRIGRKFGWIRTADRETLLRDLKQLSAAYQEFESAKQSPRSTRTAAKIWNLSQKHVCLFAPVANDERTLAVECCIGILETEDDFTKAMEIIKERLKNPFIIRLTGSARSGPGTGSATLSVVKAPFLYKIRRMLGLLPIPPERKR